MADNFELKRCFAVLIDNKVFRPDSGLPTREGAQYDKHYIAEFCKNAGFQTSESLHQRTHNLTLVQMRQLLQDVIRQDFSEYDAFAIFISSHGIKGEIRTTEGGTITVQEIVSKFENEATLQGKPKLFFLNNCLDENIMLRDEARPVAPFYVPNAYDVLIVHGSVDGYEYPRDPKKGSFGPRELKETLEEHNFEKSLTETLATVTKRSQTEGQQRGGRKQVITYFSTLTKPVYFIKPSPTSSETPSM